MGLVLKIKSMGLGLKIIIIAVIAILVQAFGIILL